MMRYIAATTSLILFSLFSLVANAQFIFEPKTYSASFSDWEGGAASAKISDISFTSCGSIGIFTKRWYEDCTNVWYYQNEADPFQLQLRTANGSSITNLATDISFGTGLSIIKNIRFTFSNQSNQTIDLSSGGMSNTLTPSSINTQAAEVKISIDGNLLDAVAPGVHTARFQVAGTGTKNETVNSSPSTTDFADISVNLAIPGRVKVSGLEDVSLMTTGADSVESSWISFCVFSQGGTEFKLRAIGRNANKKFKLKLKKGNKSIDYNLYISDSSRTEKIAPQKTFTGTPYIWFGSDNSSCNNNTNDNMRYKIEVPKGINNAKSGVYSDVVTIVVEPA